MLQPLEPFSGSNSYGTWGAALVTALVVAVAMALGLWRGRRARASKRGDSEAVGAMTGATLGLVAFILAFTFSMAAGRHDARRQLVLADANAIGTAHLRASLLTEDKAKAAQSLLLEYLDLRIAVAHDPSQITVALARIEGLQAQLWEIGRTAAREQPASIVVGLFVQALNEVFDIHSERVQVGARDRLPLSLWAALYLLIGLGMWLVGYQAGMLGVGVSFPPTILVIAFALVVMLISDLDRPQDGFLRVGQQPLSDLQQALHRAAQ